MEAIPALDQQFSSSLITGPLFYTLKNEDPRQTWCLVPVILVPGRARQDDGSKIGDILGYRVGSMPV